MQRTKSSSQTGCSSMKPINLVANFKFDKVEKLNSLVNEISDSQRGGQRMEKEAAQVSQTRQMKSGFSEKVLELMKNRIKTSYDQLYGNYNDNKNKILKQIQAVETNLAGENAMNQKFDEVAKEKGKYDKLKADAEEKQRKLKKLMDMRDQLKFEKTSSEKVDSSDILDRIWVLQQKKEQIEHQGLILANMLKDRQRVHLNLKEKYTRMLQQLNEKTEKETKISSINYKKKNMLNKIQEDLAKEEEVEIPAKLAEHLSNKLQIYENMHSYNNIIEHETILQEQRFRKMKEQMSRQRQTQRLMKTKRENEEKDQKQQLYNMYLIKNYEEEKIKKLCGVQYLEEITSGNFRGDKETLESLSQQIIRQIEDLKKQNQRFEKEISEILSSEQQLNQNENIYELQKLSEDLEKEKNFMGFQLAKKNSLVNSWETLIHLMTKDRSSKGLDDLIEEVERNMRRKQSLERDLAVKEARGERIIAKTTDCDEGSISK